MFSRIVKSVSKVSERSIQKTMMPYDVHFVY